MSYSLHSVDERDCWFDTNRWEEYLKLAHKHGWKAMGTEFLDWGQYLNKESPNYEEELKKMEEEWGGYYCSNDGQLVKKEDSLAIASALERALLDIEEYLDNPRHSNGKFSGEALKDVFKKRFCLDIETETTPREANKLLRFRKKRVQELIGFCKKGEFLIF